MYVTVFNEQKKRACKGIRGEVFYFFLHLLKAINMYKLCFDVVKKV